MTILTRSLLSQVLRTTRLPSFSHNLSCSQFQSQLRHLERDRLLLDQDQMQETQGDHPIRLDLVHQFDLFQQRFNQCHRTSPTFKCNRLSRRSIQTLTSSGANSLKMSTSKMTSGRESIVSQVIPKLITHQTHRTIKTNRRRTNP